MSPENLEHWAKTGHLIGDVVKGDEVQIRDDGAKFRVTEDPCPIRGVRVSWAWYDWETFWKIFKVNRKYG